MIVPVMRVRKVRMAMGQWLVLMPVSVFGVRRDGFIVWVLVVFVVGMLVLMFQRLVSVFMFMALGQVQPDANGH